MTAEGGCPFSIITEQLTGACVCVEWNLIFGMRRMIFATVELAEENRTEVVHEIISIQTLPADIVTKPAHGNYK